MFGYYHMNHSMNYKRLNTTTHKHKIRMPATASRSIEIWSSNIQSYKIMYWNLNTWNTQKISINYLNHMGGGTTSLSVILLNKCLKKNNTLQHNKCNSEILYHWTEPQKRDVAPLIFLWPLFGIAKSDQVIQKLEILYVPIIIRKNGTYHRTGYYNTQQHKDVTCYTKEVPRLWKQINTQNAKCDSRNLKKLK